MDTTGWVILAIVVAVVVLALIGAMAYWRSSRTSALRERFGPEYDRTVGEKGSRRDAEQELRAREQRYSSMDIQPLSDESRERFTTEWDRAEQMFVDDPELAARNADRLVRDVLQERGYPSDDLDEQAAAISVERPDLVQRYRHGHEMVESNGASRDQRTENLRKAMVDFRAVFVAMTSPDRGGEVATR
jgi:hypothetical protein